MQPTQSIQSIRYMPQYQIWLVNDLNVMNEFKILQTSWIDSIGCIGWIEWIVWIDCKSIQYFQFNQINQFNISNGMNWIGWIDLNTLTSTCFDLIKLISFFLLFRDFWNFGILAVAPANGFGTWPGGVPGWQTFLVNSKAQFQWFCVFFL